MYKCTRSSNLLWLEILTNNSGKFVSSQCTIFRQLVWKYQPSLIFFEVRLWKSMLNNSGKFVPSRCTIIRQFVWKYQQSLIYSINVQFDHNFKVIKRSLHGMCSVFQVLCFIITKVLFVVFASATWLKSFNGSLLCTSYWQILEDYYVRLKIAIQWVFGVCLHINESMDRGVHVCLTPTGWLLNV